MTEKIMMQKIKLSKKTKERIDKLRVYKRETYDEVLEKILDILNTSKVNPERARSKLLSIDRQRKRSGKS
jgi:ribosome-binding protein aMBF1 (putative translation factor)